MSDLSMKGSDERFRQAISHRSLAFFRTFLAQETSCGFCTMTAVPMAVAIAAFGAATLVAFVLLCRPGQVDAQS